MPGANALGSFSLQNRTLLESYRDVLFSGYFFSNSRIDGTFYDIRNNCGDLSCHTKKEIKFFDVLGLIISRRPPITHFVIVPTALVCLRIGITMSR